MKSTKSSKVLILELNNTKRNNSQKPIKLLNKSSNNNKINKSWSNKTRMVMKDNNNIKTTMMKRFTIETIKIINIMKKNNSKIKISTTIKTMMMMVEPLIMINRKSKLSMLTDKMIFDICDLSEKFSDILK